MNYVLQIETKATFQILEPKLDTLEARRVIFFWFGSLLSSHESWTTQEILMRMTRIGMQHSSAVVCTTILLLLISLLPALHAFAPHQPRRITLMAASVSSSSKKSDHPFSNDQRCHRRQQSRRFVLDNVLGSDGEVYFEDEAEQLKVERQRLLLTSMNHIQSNTKKKKKKNTYSSSYNSNWDDQAQMGPPPLTTIGRERFQAEMKLLESLKMSDDGLGELWKFWYNSRGKVKTAALFLAGKLSFDEAQWPHAEEILRDLIAEEGIHWAEPLNRLATLLFYQGRFMEAKEICELVLIVKPWHFGCQTGIVEVCESLKDTDGVASWSGQRMPPLDRNNDASGDSREEWVDRMLGEAQKMLDDGEQSLKDSFEDSWE
jgi:hypothetical protein